MQSILQNVVAGWIWRRCQELGSFALVLIPIYLSMPPSMQEDVRAIFTGQGGGLTITAAVGLVWYLWTQYQSYSATRKPQVVTADGQKLTPKPNSAAQKKIEDLAVEAPRNKTIFEKIFNL